MSYEDWELAPIIDIADRWGITGTEAEEFLESVGYYDRGGDGASLEDLSREEIDARLDELDEQKAAAEEFRNRVGDARDVLADLRAYEFVDDETAAKLDLLGTMLDWTIHHDVQVEQRIHYEREQLKRRRFELKHDEDGDRDE